MICVLSRTLWSDYDLGETASMLFQSFFILGLQLAVDQKRVLKNKQLVKRKHEQNCSLCRVFIL